MNEAAYAVWHGLMYCVGVFVTCNVGGMALRWGCERVSGLISPREDETPEGTSVKAANDLNAGRSLSRTFEKKTNGYRQSGAIAVCVNVAGLQ